MEGESKIGGMKRAIVLTYTNKIQMVYPWGSQVLEEIIESFKMKNLIGIKEIYVAHDFELLRTTIEIEKDKKEEKLN